MKKLGIFFIVLSLLLIFSGVFLCFFPILENGDDDFSHSKKTSSEESTENAVTQYNTNSLVLSEHCFEGVCYTISLLSYNYDAGSLVVDMRNDSGTIILQRRVKFVFDTPRGQSVVIVDSPDLEIGGMGQTESRLSDSNLVSATSYTITN